MYLDSNYITLIAVIVGFISTLLTHKYHINLHSKKIAKIETDISNVLTAVNALAEATDPKVANVVHEVNKVFTTVTEDINSDRFG